MGVRSAHQAYGNARALEIKARETEEEIMNEMDE